jgi:ribosomal protein S25
MGQERRNIQHRGALVKRVVEGIIQNPSVTLTVNTMQQWLGVSVEVAERILQRLASSGLVKEVQAGTWVRGSLASGPDWY